MKYYYVILHFTVDSGTLLAYVVR